MQYDDCQSCYTRQIGITLASHTNKPGYLHKICNQNNLNINHKITDQKKYNQLKILPIYRLINCQCPQS